MYNRKTFKREAKQLMCASTPHFMLVALVYVLLTTGLSYVVSWLTGGGGLLAGTLSVFLNILVMLFSIVMGVGLANYALRLSRREPTGMGSLFAPFSYAGRALGTQLLVALFVFLWCLLVMVVFGIVVGILFALTSSEVLLAVVVVVLYIAMLVVIISIILRYAMAAFALVDDPDVGVMEAIRRSVRMMRGYKGKYFVLELSFIGWGLLAALISVIVMGIGFRVSGAYRFVEAILLAGDDPWAVYGNMMALIDQMAVWGLLADVLSLPLTLWLTVYMQTTMARFYNYVGGYDYHQYMNNQQTPPVQEPRQPDQPPAPEEPKAPDQSGQEKQPQEPAGQDGYYTSILPPETPDESDGEEEETD